jgi:hypothetical protein
MFGIYFRLNHRIRFQIVFISSIECIDIFLSCNHHGMELLAKPYLSRDLLS